MGFKRVLKEVKELRKYKSNWSLLFILINSFAIEAAYLSIPLK